MSQNNLNRLQSQPPADDPDWDEIRELAEAARAELEHETGDTDSYPLWESELDLSLFEKTLELHGSAMCNIMQRVWKEAKKSKWIAPDNKFIHTCVEDLAATITDKMIRSMYDTVHFELDDESSLEDTPKN